MAKSKSTFEIHPMTVFVFEEIFEKDVLDKFFKINGLSIELIIKNKINTANEFKELHAKYGAYPRIKRFHVSIPAQKLDSMKIIIFNEDRLGHAKMFATDNPNIKVFVEAVNIEQFTDENLKVCTVSFISEYLKQIIKGEKQFHVTEPIEHSQDENSEAPSIEDEDYYRD